MSGMKMSPEELNRYGNTMKINPEELNRYGDLMISDSQEFGKKVTEIYDTIEEMANRDYLSPEAKVIANKIKSYQQMLLNIAKTIEGYGIHCKTYAKVTSTINENISAGIR